MHGEFYGYGMLVPLLVFGVPMAIAAGWLAPKMGDRAWIWVIVMLIPVVNSFAVLVLLVRVAGAVLDRLNALNPAQNRPRGDASAMP